MEEEIKRVTSYKVEDVKFDELKRSDFVSVYNQVYPPISCATCPGTLYNAYIKLKYHTNTIEMKNPKYIIEGDNVIDTSFATDPSVPNGHFSKSTVLDDETGEALYKAKIAGVKKNPDYKAESEQTKTIEEMTVAELKSLADSKGLDKSEYSNLKKEELVSYLTEKGITA
jgi:hypothetical protein